jgi:hypothetical protein
MMRNHPVQRHFAIEMIAAFVLCAGVSAVFAQPAVPEAVLVGADADNTGGYSLGYVDDVTLSP